MCCAMLRRAGTVLAPCWAPCCCCCFLAAVLLYVLLYVLLCCCAYVPGQALDFILFSVCIVFFAFLIHCWCLKDIFVCG
jgi:hypothetical protein